MSIQDIANVVNELNKNLVRLAEKVGEHDRELADIEYRLQQLERGAMKNETTTQVAIVEEIPQE